MTGNPIIYRIYNIHNNKSYIGQSYTSIEERFSKHKAKAFRRKANNKLSKALRDLGLSNFDYEIIEEINSENYDNPIDLQNYVDNRELFYIKFYNSIEGGYNTNNHPQGYRMNQVVNNNIINCEKLKYLFLDKNINRDSIIRELKISKGHFNRLIKKWGLTKSRKIIGITSGATKIANRYTLEQIDLFKNLYYKNNYTIEEIHKVMGISNNSVRRLKNFIIKKENDICH